MSFKVFNSDSVLNEITYKRKKSRSEQKNASAEAELQVQNIRVGKQKDSGTTFLIINFSVHLDTPAFFLYAEGVFKAEITGISEKDLNSEDYQKVIVDFVHSNHQDLVEKSAKQAIDKVLELTSTPPGHGA